MMATDVTPPRIAELEEELGTVDVNPIEREAALSKFDAQTRDALAAQLARRVAPPPAGRVVAGLALILSDRNRADVEAVYVLNLRSPDAGARRASLYGLDKLGHAAIIDFAVSALHDPDDGVLDAACWILSQRGKNDERIGALLQNTADAHRDDPRFPMSNALLEGAGYRPE
ncbi:hypothetical protein RAS1_32290 [Phycisphaerae bacterium RAS1]|nr:hypothetical protein RAS1_32290 [Phycisphaerae bacterium RAS1]